MQCPPRPGPGIKRHEPKWFRLGRFDDFPDVNSHRAVDELQLINQRDIHAAKNILQQLGRFSDATRRDWHKRVDRLAVKRHRPLKAGRRVTSYNFRNRF